MIGKLGRTGYCGCEKKGGSSCEDLGKPVGLMPGLHRKNGELQTAGTPTVRVIGRSPLSQRKLKREPSLVLVSKFRIERKSLKEQ